MTPDADPVEVARIILLDALTDRARSRSELAQLLARRGVPEEAAEEILGRFTDVGLIDDQAFASAWVESRQMRRNLSRRALRAELGRKGVDREVIEEAVSAVDPEDEYAAALDLARTKARRTVGLEPQVRLRRLAGVLARRGFSSGTVMRAAREALAEEDLEEMGGLGD